MQWGEERALYEEKVAKVRFFLVLAILVAVGLGLALLASMQEPPACHVRLFGDGTWQRVADVDPQLVDGCRLVTWEE